MSFKASFLISDNRRSPKPEWEDNVEISASPGSGYLCDIPLQRVEPPERTTFEYRDFLRSKSALLMQSTINWWIPRYSSPISSGWNRISGALNLSAPIYVQISERNKYMYTWFDGYSISYLPWQRFRPVIQSHRLCRSFLSLPWQDSAQCSMIFLSVFGQPPSRPLYGNCILIFAKATVDIR